MTLSTAGVLSGTPNAAGNYSFDIIVSDSTPAIDGGPFESAAVSYSLAVTDPTVTMNRSGARQRAQCLFQHRLQPDLLGDGRADPA